MGKPFLLLLLLIQIAIAGTDEDSLRWIEMPVPTKYPSSVTMVNDSQGWYIDTEAHLFQWDGKLWQPTPTIANEQNKVMFVNSETDVWVHIFLPSQYRNTLKHFDGQRWQIVPTPNVFPIRDLYFLSPQEGWAVGEWGEIMHYTSGQWHPVSSPTYYHLNCIRMVSKTRGWIVGESRGRGIILQYQAPNWLVVTDSLPYEPSKIVVKNDSICWFNNVDNIYQLGPDSISDLQVPPDIFKNESGLQKMVKVDTTIGFTTDRLQFYIYQKQKWQCIPFQAHTYADNWQIFNRKLFRYNAGVIFGAGLHKKYRGFSKQEIEDSNSAFGVAVGDLNGDDLLDIYAVNHFGKNYLILSSINPTVPFLPGSAVATEKAGISDPIYFADPNRPLPFYDSGVSLADYDNDGDTDLYLCSMYFENMLFNNNGAGKFRDVTASAGVGGEKMAFSQMGIWGDVNNDGYLDLFVTNQTQSDRLYLNDRSGHFQDITAASGLTSDWGSGSPIFGDIDNDGDPDLLIPHLHGRIRLMMHRGLKANSGIPIFKDMTARCGLDTSNYVTSRACLFGDVDNDGDLDLFITRAFASNQLYLNNGNGFFTDVTHTAGLYDSCNTNSAIFFDADNDGFLDLYLGNQGPNRFYRNRGNATFEDLTDEMGLECLGNTQGLAYGDFNFVDQYCQLADDGALDLYIANLDQPSICFVNYNHRNGFLKFKLVGTRSNRDAIGARLWLYKAGHMDDPAHLLGLRDVQGGAGFCSMSSTILHFGATSGQAYDVHIVFPSGKSVRRYALPADQTIAVYEDEGWQQFVVNSGHWLRRNLNQPTNYYEAISGASILVLILASFRFCKVKSWGNHESLSSLLWLPIILFIGTKLLTSDRSPVIYWGLPLLIGMATLTIGLWYNQIMAKQISRDELMLELLTASRAFDHSQIQASYLNQLGLLINNLEPDKKAPDVLAVHLGELVSNFYQHSYPEIKRIQALAIRVFPNQTPAIQLRQTLLKLSENLDEIKIIVKMNKIIPVHLLKSLDENLKHLKLGMTAIAGHTDQNFATDVVAALDKLRHIFQHKQIRIEVHAPADNEPIYARIGAKDFHFIFENLFENAIRALNESATRQITITIEPDANDVNLYFRDTGCGIDPELHNSLFQDGVTSKTSGSGGFGLYHSQEVIQKFGGKIVLHHSAIGQGTEFLVTLRRIGPQAGKNDHDFLS